MPIDFRPAVVTAAIAYMIAPWPIARAQSAGFDFSATDAMRWIPLGGVDDRKIILPITINGRTVNALIDSGSANGHPITISRRFADSFKIDVLPAGKANAYGGVIDTYRGELDSLEIGGLKLKHQFADVIDMSVFASDKIDAIIGTAVLRSMLLEVDWGNRQARFLLTGDMAATDNDVSTSVDGPTGFLVVNAEICGSKYPMILDTGAEDDAHISANVISLENCTSVVRSDMAESGLGGRNVKEVVGLDAIKLGSRNYQGIVAGIEGRDDPLGKRNIPGSIGLGLLRRSNFALDAGADRLKFFGPYRYGQRIERPTLGIQFRDDTTQLTITHIMSNSPAAGAPLQVGDGICAVNGKSVAAWNGYYPMNPAPGSPTQIKLCNGANVMLVSQDFLASGQTPQNLPDVQELPVDIGRATAALAACQGRASQQAVNDCSFVIAQARILPYYHNQARFLRAQMLGRMQQPALAVADVDTLILQQGRTAPLLALRGHLQSELGNYAQAGHDLDAAIAADTNFVPARLYRAMLSYRMGDYQSGIDIATGAVAREKDNYVSLNVLAQGFLYRNMFQEALRLVSKAIALEEGYSDSYVTRGQIYAKLGQPELARSDFERALRLDPTAIEAVSGLQALDHRRPKR